MELRAPLAWRGALLLWHNKSIMTPDLLFNLGLRAIFFILLLSYTIYGLILAYHWLTYGTTYRTTYLLILGYLVGGIICFALMAPAII